MQIGIFRHSSGRLIDANPAMAHMFGYNSVDELMKVPATSLFRDPRDRNNLLKEVKLNGFVKDCIVPMQRKDSSPIWCSFTVNAQFDVNGSIKWIEGTIEDITERKQAEETLENNNTFLKTLLDAIPAPVFYKDLELRYIDINSAFEQFYGITRQEMIGKSVFDSAPKELAEIYHAQDMELILHPGQQTYESQVNNAHGEVRNVIFHTATFTDQSGNVRGIIGAILDITTHKKLELEQLKNEKLESLGILAGGIAHDFNNILTGIMGNISLAQMYLDSTSKSYKPLVDAEKASERAALLARQLLTFARGGKPVKKAVSLQHLVNEAVSLVLRGSNVKGTVEIPDTIHTIEADEGQMTQVFHNIIINAMQAMPGGGTLTVSAQNETLYNANSMTLPGGSYVRLSFADQGCGISESDLKKIFDPYFTTKFAGNGLGLASAHSIINKHGGHIGVSSVIGKGTIFTVFLPSIGETNEKLQNGSVSQSIGVHTGGSILVMDDDEVIRDMTTAILEYLGYQSTTCKDGAEALAQFKAARESGLPFSAVIMDLTIPGGMGGKEAAQQILAIDPNACLIVSSGYSNDPIMSDYNTYGFKGAMAKPYKMAEFGQLLSSMLSAL